MFNVYWVELIQCNKLLSFDELIKGINYEMYYLMEIINQMTISLWMFYCVCLVFGIMWIGFDSEVVDFG